MKSSRILSGFVVAALLLSGCKQEKAPPLSAAGPPQVVVAAVEQRDVPIVREWIGQLDGSENVDLRARVNGYIQEIAFKEGTVVKPETFYCALIRGRWKLRSRRKKQTSPRRPRHKRRP